MNTIWVGIITLFAFICAAECMAINESNEKGKKITRGGSCGENVSWSLEDTVLNISGTGDMMDYSSVSVAPWDPYRSRITALYIEEGVRSIGNYSFASLSSLTIAVIPASVVSLGVNCFRLCTSLSEITIPNSVKSLGASSFFGCKLLNNITLSSSLAVIDGYTFGSCSQLKSMIIPEGVISIENNAFDSCKDLINITLPATVRSIGDQAFSSCSSLSSIDVADENPVFASIDGVLFDKELKVIFKYPPGKTNLSYSIPSSVSLIGNYSFYSSALISVEIPDSVASVGTCAFAYCSKLKNATFSNALRIIGDKAFLSCKQLQEITLQDGLETIGAYSFSGDEQLKNITIPDSVAFIGGNSFDGCKRLTAVMLPKRITSIEKYLFRSCSSLARLFLPDGVTAIGRNAFASCGSLTELMIPNTVLSIGDLAFSGCKSFKNISIPASVVSIGMNVFPSSINLTSINVAEDNPNYASVEGVLFGFNLTTVVRYPPGKNSSSFIIPSTVTSIDDYSFYGCKYLKQVIIPPSVSSIRANAFAYSNLTNVTIPSNVTTISEYAFFNCLCLIDVTLSHGVSSIGDYAFNGCENLKKITMPDSVVSIGERVFSYCYNLTNVRFSHGLKSIGNYSFRACKSLTSLVIPDSVVSIGKLAFDECSKVVNISIPDSVKFIGDSAFSNNKGLVSVFYGGSTLFSSNALYSCDNLVNMCVPPDYNSSQFCSVEVTNTTTCQSFQSMFGLCNKAAFTDDGVLIQKKRTNVVEWEEQSDECITFQCSDDMGFTARSICNNTDDNTRICLDHKCFVDETPSKDTWSVEIELDERIKELTDINETDVISTIHDLTGIDVDKLAMGTKVDENGNIIIVIYLEDDESANFLAFAVNGIEKGEDCPYLVLCFSKRVTVIQIGMIEVSETAKVVDSRIELLLMIVMIVTATR